MSPGFAGAAIECAPPPPVGAEGVAELLLTVRLVTGEEEMRSVLADAGGRFWVDEELLTSWRVEQMPAQRRDYAGLHWYALDAVDGLRFRYDACAQQLAVELAGVGRSALQYSVSGRRRSARPAQADPGAYLNLDALYTRAAGDDFFGLIGEAVVFGPRGRLTQSGIVDQDSARRLETTWTSEWPDRRLSLSLGDAVSSAGAWGRPVRYAGVRLATDYGLQPYFVPYPQPTLRGGVELPSTLDVFVNDSLRARQSVAEGPFELHDLPTLTGGGEAMVVMRDPLGRETRVRLPFYVSPELLRAGLTDYAFDVGAQRRRYGFASFDYRDPFAAGTARRGLTDWLTAEARAEARREGGAGGASLFWQAGGLGLVSLSAAYGGLGQHRGAMGSIGIERNIFGRYALSLRSQWAEPGFRQLGQPDALRAPRHTDFASLSFTPHPRGTLALAYAHEDRRGEPDLDLRTLGYTVQLGRSWLAGLSYSEARAGDRTRSVALTASFQFGRSWSASAGHEWRNRDGDAWRASVQRNADGPLGVSYRADVETGEFERAAVRADWGTGVGVFTGEAGRDGGGSALRFGAATSLVWMGGQPYVTRQIQNGFAVVSAAGLPDVGVYLDNRLVARTRGDGSALVPDLRPYQENAISLHADEVPVEWSLQDVDRVVVPRARSGLILDFNPGDRIGAELVVVTADGEPVPTNAVVQDAVSGERYPVGIGGRVYVRAAPGPRVLKVSAPGLRCDARLDLKAQTEPEALRVDCAAEPS